MRALVWHGPRSMTLAEVADPVAGPGDVVVRVEAVGICGSELSGYLGHNALRVPPLVMGHEFAGSVAAAGPGAAIATGARVTVNPLLTCGRCAACRAGRANLCAERRLVGAHLPGAFAERVTVPAAACAVLPDGLDEVDGALAEPLACAVRAVALADLAPGARLHVLGAGPIGLLCALVARAAGAETTISDPNPARAATAEAWGLTAVAAGEPGAAATIDAVGLQVTRRAALELLGRGGTAVFVGLHEPAAAFDGNDLVRDERTVRGCFAYTPADFAAAVRHLAAGLLPARGGWLAERPLEDGPASFDELVGPNPSVVKVILRPETPTAARV